MKSVLYRIGFVAPLVTLAMAAQTFAFGQESPGSPGISSQTKPIFGVLSLVGDRFEMFGAQPQVGSRLDTTDRAIVPLSDASLDNIVVEAVARAVKRSLPQAEISQLNARSSVLFEKHATLFAERDGHMSLPEPIKNALQAEKATHFILVTKHRRAADAKLASVARETKFEGLGFFADGLTNTRNIDTGTVNLGYLAAYAYMQICVAEVPTGERRECTFVSNSRLLGSSEIKRVSGMGWDSISMQERLDGLAKLIRDEIDIVIPQLVKVKKK